MTKLRSVYILGSSRSDGDTRIILDYLCKKNTFEIIDLLDYKISYFDYEHNNSSDDYLPLMREILNNYDHLIFATPVYWYSMSAIMKCFFDRITDLLKVEKDLGRKLRGKYMSLISCSSSDELDPSFVFFHLQLPLNI